MRHQTRQLCVIIHIPTWIAGVWALLVAFSMALPTLERCEPSGKLSFKLFEKIDIVVGQVAQLEGTGIEVLLVEAHGPRPGCFDCPNTATLRVHSGGKMQELHYVFSGNMPFKLLQKVRRKTAFRFVFIVVKIVEGGLTLRVEPDAA